MLRLDMMTLQRYLHLVMLKGLLSFSNPDRWTGHIIAVSRVCQAGQDKRIEPDEK